MKEDDFIDPRVAGGKYYRERANIAYADVSVFARLNCHEVVQSCSDSAQVLFISINTFFIFCSM